jgi:hypothetical protein
MKSAPLGKTISEVEISSISNHGFWLFLQGRELFLSFDQFPWFRKAEVGKILNVELLHEHHLYWPDLDIDLTVGSIEHPELYLSIPIIRSEADSARTGEQSAAAGIPRSAGMCFKLDLYETENCGSTERL